MATSPDGRSGEPATSKPAGTREKLGEKGDAATPGETPAPNAGVAGDGTPLGGGIIGGAMAGTQVVGATWEAAGTEYAAEEAIGMMRKRWRTASERESARVQAKRKLEPKSLRSEWWGKQALR